MVCQGDEHKILVKRRLQNPNPALTKILQECSRRFVPRQDGSLSQVAYDETSDYRPQKQLMIHQLKGLLTRFLSKNKEVLRVVLAVCMGVAGTLHFAASDPFIRIVPDFLPYPAALVYISGIIEIGLGVALLLPPVSQWAAWGLVALFIAVYPANLNMAINHIHIDGIPDGWWFQAIRLPFQFVLIAWAYWYTKPDTHPDQASILPGYPRKDR